MSLVVYKSEPDLSESGPGNALSHVLPGPSYALSYVPALSESRPGNALSHVPPCLSQDPAMRCLMSLGCLSQDPAMRCLMSRLV
jgi:hypothetical protein